MYCLHFPREGGIPRQASPCLRESRILVWMMSRSHSEITACSRGTVPGHPDRLPALWLHFLSAEAGLWTQKYFPWVLGWQFSSCRAAWGLEPGTWSSCCDTECGNRCILEGELWASCARSLQSSPRLFLLFLSASSSSGHSWPKQRSHTSLSAEPSVIRACLPKAVFGAGINVKPLRVTSRDRQGAADPGRGCMAAIPSPAPSTPGQAHLGTQACSACRSVTAAGVNQAWGDGAGIFLFFHLIWSIVS